MHSTPAEKMLNLMIKIPWSWTREIGYYCPSALKLNLSLSLHFGIVFVK